MAAACAETPFRRALLSIFKSWQALQIAVENGSGGRDTNAAVEWLPAALEGYMNDEEKTFVVDQDRELLEYTLAVMLWESLNLEVDDHSMPEICSKILDAYRMSKLGKTDEVISKYCTSYVPPLPRVTYETGDDSSSDSADDEAMDTATSSTIHTQNAPTETNNRVPEKTGEGNQDDTTMEEDDEWTTVRKHKRK